MTALGALGDQHRACAKKHGEKRPHLAVGQDIVDRPGPKVGAGQPPAYVGSRYANAGRPMPTMFISKMPSTAKPRTASIETYRSAPATGVTGMRSPGIVDFPEDGRLASGVNERGMAQIQPSRPDVAADAAWRPVRRSAQRRLNDGH